MKTFLGFNRADIRLGFNFFKMNLRDRYLGSSLGSIWAILNPLMMLGIYTFVFGFVFKSKLPGAETTLAYVVWLISGYGPWLATTEGITAATTSVTGSVGIVKNMAFKVEILPLAAAGVAVVSLSVALFFTLVLNAVDGKLPTVALLLLPVIVGVHFLIIGAIGLWLAAANVFIRDLSLVLPNILMVFMFTTPIFFPITVFPSLLQKVTYLNPFYQISEFYRGMLLQGSCPSAVWLFYVFLFGAFVFASGLKAFRRTKGYFDSAL
jgi:lipopolysaccharide transport system permease protein